MFWKHRACPTGGAPLCHLRKPKVWGCCSLRVVWNVNLVGGVGLAWGCYHVELCWVQGGAEFLLWSAGG